jgi:predicted metal-dependent HD superfamily phosphohydrolase
MNLELQGVSNLLVNRATKYYALNSANRQYHNTEHMENVVRAVQESTPNPSDALLLAAVWHDAIYMPGAGSDANERCSAASLKSEYWTLRTNEQYDHVIVQAMDHIVNTRIEVHLSADEIDGDLAILLDADLKSLAGSYDTFIETQEKVIKENGGNWAEHKAKSGEFLAKFLTCRKHIYHAAYGRKNWEEQARANIARLVG